MSLPWRALVIIALLSVASGFVDLRMRAYPTRAYTEFVPAVVAGTADAPERYRVLVPFGVEALTRATGVSPSTAWHSTRLVLFFVGYCTFFVYLRTWFAPNLALLGTAIVAGTWPLTLTNSWAHPDHVAELFLFTAGCLAIARQRPVWIFATLALASLNRETAVFLVPLYLLAGAVTASRLLVAGLLGLTWLMIYAGLRLWRGFASYEYLQVSRNLDFLRLLPEGFDPYYRAYAYFGLLLFGGLIVVALYHTEPSKASFVTRSLWVVPMFTVVAFTISSIIESRIFTPLYPVVMPAVMTALTTADNTTSALRSREHHV
jgi:hypothetical protein